MPSRYNPTAALFPLIIVGLLAGMTFWLDQTSRPPAVTTDGKSRHDPDFIVENFVVRRFDREGALQHTLRAEVMRHYPDDDSTVIRLPHLTFHRQPPTLITAREARLDSAGKHVQMIDAVRVSRSGLGGKPDTVLTTARLDAFPDEELATSEVPVTIEQGRSSINGSGLNANNKTSIYVLEGPVYGIFHRAAGGTPAAAQAVTINKPASKTKPQPNSKAKPEAKPKSKSRPDR